MTTIAVVNRSDADDRDVAFWAEAWNQQAREVAEVWGVGYTPVVFYSSAEGLPSADCRILSIKPEIDAPGALGFHDVEGGAVFAEIKYTGPDTSVTGSHEICEELVDPLCNRWAPYDADHEQAVETCDRVEAETYALSVTVAGETRPVRVSDYLLPRAFGEATDGPFDKLGKISSVTAMTAGGYTILRDITTGKVGDVYARHRGPHVIAGPAAGFILAEKLAKRGSRLLRRLRVTQ